MPFVVQAPASQRKSLFPGCVFPLNPIFSLSTMRMKGKWFFMQQIITKTAKNDL